VLELTHKKSGGYRGEFHYLGEAGGPLNGNPAAVTLSGQSFKFSLERRDAGFEGILSADGKSIAGTWKSGAAVVPVTFTRAGTDFVIDPAPHKASFVTVGQGVKLEVLDFGGGSGGGNCSTFSPPNPNCPAVAPASLSLTACPGSSGASTTALITGGTPPYLTGSSDPGVQATAVGANLTVTRQSGTVLGSPAIVTVSSGSFFVNVPVSVNPTTCP
jgi:hypothetical protein